jgi:hypothetical protein
MAAILTPSFSPTVIETESYRRALVPRARGEARHVETSDRACIGAGRDRGQRARYKVWTIAHAGRCEREWNTAVPI